MPPARPWQLLVIIFLFAISVVMLIRKQKTKWFVAFGEFTGCRVGLVLFSLLVVTIRPPCWFIRKYPEPAFLL
jgi:hypothetical protein